MNREYWSRRSAVGKCHREPGRWTKTQTHRAERRAAKSDEEIKAYRDYRRSRLFEMARGIDVAEGFVDAAEVPA